MSTNIQFGDISNYICRKEDVSFSQINTESRKRELVQIRHIIMYMSNKFSGLTLEEIGLNFISGGDHSNVLYACNNIQNLYDTDHAWRNKIDFYSSHFKELQKNKYLYIPILPDLVDLKKIRTHLNISLEKSAAGIPMVKSFIWKIENGERGSQLPYNTVKKMLDFYRKTAMEKDINIISY